MWSLLISWLLWPLATLLARIRHRNTPQHILLVQTAKIGDMVCTLPLIEAIAAALPATGSVSLVHAPLTTPLIAHHPALTRRITWSHAQLRGWKGRWRVLRLLWSAQIDTVIVASPSLLWLTIPYWLGVTRRIAILPPQGGRTWRWGAKYLTHAQSHDIQRLLLDEWHHLLAPLGMQVGHHATVYPRPLTDEKLALTAAARVGHPVLGLGISSANPLKELQESQLLTLIQASLNRWPTLQIILIGSQHDAERAARLHAAVGHHSGVHTATGSYTLDTLPYLLRALSVYVGVDSGITYLADACAVPVISLTGPTNPHEQRPLHPEAQLVINRLPCVPCAFVFNAPRHCHLGTQACVAGLDMDTVLTRIAHQLEKSHG